MQYQDYRGIPSVSRLLETPALRTATATHGRRLLLPIVRRTLDALRSEIHSGSSAPLFEDIVARVVADVACVTDTGLKRVINCTGVLLHTNLGRAPFGRELLEEIFPVLEGYSNLEFHLDTGERGHRMEHLAPLLRLATGAESALAVNNNAAAVLLALHTFARGKEVITSRGELIEIGGSFRMPDIIDESGARLVEVGTTNRTRIEDYARAITDDTAVILKSHCSNYEITGFTEQTSIRALSALAHARGLLLLHDIGSGILFESADMQSDAEPDVASSLADGADLVMFSCDKLLGGPQAGVLAGRDHLIAELASRPLLRALRLDKVAIALLRAVILRVLSDDDTRPPGALAVLLRRSPSQRLVLAEKLAGMVQSHGVPCTVIESRGCFGGGSIPGREIASVAVRIESGTATPSADRMLRTLLRASTPVVAVLREGHVCLDILAMGDEELPLVADAVREVVCDI